MTTAEVIKLISESLPAKVVQMDWQNPQLFIVGSEWTLAVMTAWRVLYQDRFVCGSDDAEPDVLAEVFEGNVITQCLQQSAVAQIDPMFVFASGHMLEIFSVGPLEPWIFTHQDGTRFIASPSE